jgi:hypothetical protein
LQAHEYSVIGHSRSTVGRYLGTVAAAIAAGSAAAAAAISGIATSFGLPAWVQAVIVLPISASMAYTGVYWLFNRYGWKRASQFLQFPDIDGIWDCDGRTIADDGSEKEKWRGEVTISQSWEKISVDLKTQKSGSYSISAALLPKADGSWLLLYSYRNEPRAGEPELHAHLGYCELRFSKGLQEAEGDYFNARGRSTSGRMNLTRRK